MMKKLLLVATLLTVFAAPAFAQFEDSQESEYHNREVNHPNCSAARAAGAAPIYAGAPGYHHKLDRDNDGVACE